MEIKKMKFLINFYKGYLKLVLQVKPSKVWIFVRFFLHWVTLPLKLIIIGSLGLFQILMNEFFLKQRKIPQSVPFSTKRMYFLDVFQKLPILFLSRLTLYTNRVPFYQLPNKFNHNTDHQCLRQGTFVFLMHKIGKLTQEMNTALIQHIQHPWLCRGYKWNPYDDTITYNIDAVSGDMLCGLNLGLINQTLDLNMIESYDLLVQHIIENDYALLEGVQPNQNEYHYDAYMEAYNKAMGNPYAVRLKSIRGMWQPGIESAGALALTLLATLRIADKKLKSRSAGKEYKKLLWLYGYGLLSLFPTAYIKSRRGYSNDHNCLTSLYILSKLSDSKWGKLFWKIPMLYTWMLSKYWYNGFFTGLVKECYPESITEKYIQKCQNYLYEEMPRTWGKADPEYVISTEEPAPFNLIAEDEFSPDIPSNHIFKTQILPEEKIHTGLGFIANAIMLEQDPSKLL